MSFGFDCCCENCDICAGSTPNFQIELSNFINFICLECIKFNGTFLVKFDGILGEVTTNCEWIYDFGTVCANPCDLRLTIEQTQQPSFIVQALLRTGPFIVVWREAILGNTLVCSDIKNKDINFFGSNFVPSICLFSPGLPTCKITAV